MTPASQVRLFVLRSLDAHGPQPMPEEVLLGALKLARFNQTDGELRSHVKACEASGWIAGVTDDLLGVVWQLTTAGRLRLQQLS